MAWTTTETLRNHLAGGGSLQTAINGGTLRIYNDPFGSGTLLSQHNVGTTSVSTNQVTVPFNSSTVQAGIDNQTATNAEIRNSSNAVLLITNNVGTGGADIAFNQNTGWSAGDTVSPGNATITLTVSAA
jgi:hypothetical protein